VLKRLEKNNNRAHFVRRETLRVQRNASQMLGLKKNKRTAEQWSNRAEQ
jgi:hypothetical protein